MQNQKKPVSRSVALGHVGLGRLFLAEMSSAESGGILAFKRELGTTLQELLPIVGTCLRAETLGSHCRLPRTDGADLYTYFDKDGAERPSDKLGRPIVAVAQTAQAIMGKYATRGYAASSAPRRSLSQSKMRTVFVMVGDVLGKQPLQVPLVESNHMAEQLATAAFHPALGNAMRTSFESPWQNAGFFTPSGWLSSNLHETLPDLNRPVLGCDPSVLGTRS